MKIRKCCQNCKHYECCDEEDGGETIVVHADIIGELLSDLGILAQGLDYMQANFGYDNDYWMIDKLEYLEQCTGLKDRNGTFIYEGDWIKDKDGYIAHIVWFNGAWWLKSEPSQAMDRENEETYAEFEVIGNIHENKELLK